MLNSFAPGTDFAQLVKVYGQYGQHEAARRYFPNPIVEVITRVRTGNPVPRHISISFIEWQNLTMRVHLRRLTQLMNALSKKLVNLT